MDTTSYVTPFVMSVQNVFETMLQLSVNIGTPEMKRSCEPCHDVSGIIAMSGDMEGSIVLSFPTATAERVVALFVGEELAATHEDFADAVGELVNMVSGGAKARSRASPCRSRAPRSSSGRATAFTPARTSFRF